MKKKLLKKYILLFLLFLCGGILYLLGIFNIISTLLFFCGGYVFLKNIMDYRIVKRNINKVNSNLDKGSKMDECYDIDRDNIRDCECFISKEKDDGSIYDLDNDRNRKYNRYEDIPGLKSTRRYVKVRRRY